MCAAQAERLETERQILRPFAPRDLPAILDLFGDAEVNTYLPWFPLRTMEDARRFYQERFAGASGYVYAICLKERDVPVGYVHADVDGGRDLGYALAREYWGRGIATEAAGRVVEQLRRDGAPFLTATHDVNNPRSGEVMRRIGMRYCYSYREQWQPKDFPVVFRMYQMNLDGREDRVYRAYWERYGEHFVEAGL